MLLMMMTMMTMMMLTTFAITMMKKSVTKTETNLQKLKAFLAQLSPTTLSPMEKQRAFSKSVLKNTSKTASALPPKNSPFGEFSIKV